MWHVSQHSYRTFLCVAGKLVRLADVFWLTYKSNKEFYDNRCLIRSVCMHRTGTERSEAETIKPLNDYPNVSLNLSFENIRGVAFGVHHIVDQVAEVNILVFDMEVSDTGITGQLAQRYLRRFNPLATLLAYPVCFRCEQSVQFISLP